MLLYHVAKLELQKDNVFYFFLSDKINFSGENNRLLEWLVDFFSQISQLGSSVIQEATNVEIRQLVELESTQQNLKQQLASLENSITTMSGFYFGQQLEKERQAAVMAQENLQAEKLALEEQSRQLSIQRDELEQLMIQTRRSKIGLDVIQFEINKKLGNKMEEFIYAMMARMEDYQVPTMAQAILRTFVDRMENIVAISVYSLNKSDLWDVLDDIARQLVSSEPFSEESVQAFSGKESAQPFSEEEEESS